MLVYDVRTEAALVPALRKSMLSLVETLYQEQKTGNLPALMSEIVFRADTRWNWNLSDEFVASVCQILEDCSSYRLQSISGEKITLLLSSDYKFCAITQKGVLQPQKLNKLVTQAQNSEMQKMLETSGALYYTEGTSLYKLPSGVVSDNFVRTGNIQHNFSNVEAVWFWCLPYLENAKLIIGDTWSIGTTLSVICKRLSGYDTAKTESELHWNYFSGYVGDVDKLKELFEEPQSINYVKNGEVFFLHSSTHTGNSVSQTKSVFEEIAGENSGNIALSIFDLKSQNASGDSLLQCKDFLESMGCKGVVNDFDQQKKQIYAVDQLSFSLFLLENLIGDISLNTLQM